MEQWLEVSRAARLAGVTRAAIQRKIAEGSLPAFEGRVQMAHLLEHYPDVRVRGSSMVEVVSQIKEDAVVKEDRRRSGVYDIDELLAEVKQLRREAAFLKEQSDRYRQVILDLKGMLTSVREKLEPRQRPFLDAVIQWVTNKTKHNY